MRRSITDVPGQIKIEGLDAEGAEADLPDPESISGLISSVFDGEGADFGEISIVFLDDEKIREVNNNFLGHDYPTDVITFPLGDEGSPVEGEIYVGYMTTVKNAAEYGVPKAQEVMRVVTHGVLHLLGYDDATDEKRAEMKTLEDKYLKRVGLLG